MEQCYGVNEAAGILGVSSSLVRKLVREGKLKSGRVGDRVVIRASELEKLVVSQ